jgi:hypothetical protein
VHPVGSLLRKYITMHGPDNVKGVRLTTTVITDLIFGNTSEIRTRTSLRGLHVRNVNAVPTSFLGIDYNQM